MEIERMLRRYGAGAFISGWDQDGRQVIRFTAHNRQVCFVVEMPSKEEFETTDTGRIRRKAPLIDKAWEQACSERWRALALVIKAKLEAVESKISTFEDEFLANTVLPNGATVGQWAQPQLDAAYSSGAMPKLMLTSGK